MVAIAKILGPTFLHALITRSQDPQIPDSVSLHPGYSLLLGFLQRVVIELKLLHGSLKQTLQQGLEQTWRYMDFCGADEGHLVIFDRAPGKSWEEKLFQREEMFRGQAIHVWGM